MSVLGGEPKARDVALAAQIMTNTSLTGATYDIDGDQQLVGWQQQEVETMKFLVEFDVMAIAREDRLRLDERSSRTPDESQRPGANT